MNKFFSYIKTNYQLMIVIIIILVISIMLFKKCTHDFKNEIVTDSYISAQKTETNKFSDSLNYSAQAVLLAQTQAHVALLESALQKELALKIKLGKTIASVEYKDSIVYIKVPGKRDTFYVPTAHYTTGFPMTFRNNNKYINQTYTVFSPDSSSIDKLVITNTGHIVVGETGKWYQKKTLVLGFLNENPYIKIDTLHSVIYHPKEKIQISFGPTLLVNKKGTSLGAGVTFKKGLFSGSIGYKIY